MPKKHRISHSEHQSLRKSSMRRLVGTYVSISYTKRPAGAKESLFACVVSKKVLRRAVDRNLIKRRCRAIFSHVLPSVKDPLSFVVYAKKGVAEASFQELQRDILNLLHTL